MGLCLRVVELQSLTIVNGSGGEASVDVGTDSFTIASGQSQATETVGTYAGIGEVFDLYVAELDISVVVQVLPIE